MQPRVRFHSIDYVLSEIDHILCTVGKVDYLYFIDVMFLAKWNRIERLCQELIRMGHHKQFKWAATVSANDISEDKIKLMKWAGCFYLSFGFESNSARVLKIINKRATPEDNRKACDLCKKYGLYVNSAFLFGIPGEDKEDLQQTIDFVTAYRVEFTGVNLMMPLPGSPFYQQFVRQGILRPSVEEWRRISSLQERSKIFNDKLTGEDYRTYMEAFDRAIWFKRRCAHLRANWRMSLKYLFAERGN